MRDEEVGGGGVPCSAVAAIEDDMCIPPNIHIDARKCYHDP